MLSEFDELVKQRQSLKAWWANAQRMDCLSGLPYRLRVDVRDPSMVAYCGQAYTGASNYHEAPPFFCEGSAERNAE